MNDETTWLLVSDGSRARIFELEDRSGPNGWMLLRAFEHPQTRTDKPLRDIERDRFARDLIDLLEAACRNGEFVRLALIAPPRLLGTLLAGFSPRVRARITTSLARDCTPLEAEENGDNPKARAARA